MTATVRSTADLTADPTADMTADLAQARAWHQAGQLDLARQGYLALLARPACAAVMAESALFASFSYLEGLGLPPQEAMASGQTSPGMRSCRCMPPVYKADDHSEMTGNRRLAALFRQGFSLAGAFGRRMRGASG